MKRIMSVIIGGVAVVALSGCGGGGGDNPPVSGGGGNNPSVNQDVDILDLDLGFIIDGHNDAGEDVTLEYCNGNYEYYSGSGHWYGHFSISGDRINMFDDTSTGGSYRIDTLNNYLEVGEWYSIDFQNDEITVEQITEDLNC